MIQRRHEIKVGKRQFDYVPTTIALTQNHEPPYLRPFLKNHPTPFWVVCAQCSLTRKQPSRTTCSIVQSS